LSPPSQELLRGSSTFLTIIWSNLNAFLLIVELIVDPCHSVPSFAGCPVSQRHNLLIRISEMSDKLDVR
jgi:hypothetical protein